MVISVHQQPRDKLKSIYVNWQQLLQMGISRFRSAAWLVTPGPSLGETREDGSLWTQHTKTASGFVYVLR